MLFRTPNDKFYMCAPAFGPIPRVLISCRPDSHSTPSSNADNLGPRAALGQGHGSGSAGSAPSTALQKELVKSSARASC
jgi:hypothetical protein